MYKILVLDHEIHTNGRGWITDAPLNMSLTVNRNGGAVLGARFVSRKPHVDAPRVKTTKTREQRHVFAVILAEADGTLPVGLGECSQICRG